MIATDTLAVRHGDGIPLSFTTKAFFIPHMRLVIAGTGVGGFLDAWHVILNTRMVARDVGEIAARAPSILPELWAFFRREQKITADVTTTVYHFGFSEGVIRAFAYRSSENFREDEIRYGLGVKPECEVPENYNLPEDFKSMMREQRAKQEKIPRSKRVYIGGEIQVHHLMRAGCNVFTLDTFEDYEEQRDMIARSK